MSIISARDPLLESPRRLPLFAVAVIVILACWGLAVPLTAVGDIRLPKIFCDSMVLQRQAEVHLSGVADPDEPLVLVITGPGADNREIKTVCNSQGEFSMKFAPPPVGGPYELTVTGTKSKVVIRDVLVGDVWLCAGQSNMAWPIHKTPPTEVQATETPRPQLRLLTIPHTASPQPLRDVNGNVAWASSTAISAAEFSAVGWHFGSLLEQELQVPIGVIHSSWGGTKAESWLSQESLSSEPSLQPLREAANLLGDNGKPQDQLNSLYNGMIAPLREFPIKGVVWYQGEANVGRAAQYGVLLPLLIQDWRQQWQTPHLPFLLVQLAPFRYKNLPTQALPELWEVQLNTVKTLPRTGMVVITDLGNPEDVHPLQKQEVGKRVSAWALAEVYHSRQLFPFDPDPADVPAASANGVGSKPTSEAALNGELQPYSGPLFRAATVEGDRMVVEFYAGEGLRSRDGQPLREFLVAGEDRVFHPAIATIENDRVIVTSEHVSTPVAVRFSWTDTPSGNLVNAADLPASPFRSDDFPAPSHK